jgi:hypothetical protein
VVRFIDVTVMLISSHAPRNSAVLLLAALEMKVISVRTVGVAIACVDRKEGDVDGRESGLLRGITPVRRTRSCGGPTRSIET